MGTTLEREIMFGLVTTLPIYTPIKSVWLAVLNFLDWYEKVKKEFEETHK